MFGKPLYPIISDKAAGNKGTGLEAGLAFLKLNGFRLNRNLLNESLFDFIIKVASGETTLEECRAWFKKHTVSL
jgi:death-on-curing protein